MGYPLKKHAHGYNEKTVCGKRTPQLPFEALTGRAEWVTCKRCGSILAKYPESIPPRFLPASPAARRSPTLIIRGGSLPKGDRDDAG